MGIPFAVNFDGTTTGADLYREAWKRCERIFMRENTNIEQIAHVKKMTSDLLAEAAAKPPKATPTPEAAPAEAVQSEPDKGDAAKGEPVKGKSTKNEAGKGKAGKGETVRVVNERPISSSCRPLLHEEHVPALDESCEYPFRLAVTRSSYFSCALCPDRKKCLGCIVPCDDNVLPWEKLCEKSSRVFIAVDWCHNCLKEDAALEHSTTMVFKDKSVNVLRPLKDKMYTLEDCLTCFLNEEQLDENEEWYCSRCKEHKRALKKIDIWRLPRILVIHLKRFSFAGGSHHKITTTIELPPNGLLDLSKFVTGPSDGQELYRLYAVSNHTGGVGFGHYTAHCLNQTTGQWYFFNDESTTPVTYSKLSGSTAYILFFERVSKQTSGASPQPR